MKKLQIYFQKKKKQFCNLSLVEENPRRSFVRSFNFPPRQISNFNYPVYRHTRDNTYRIPWSHRAITRSVHYIMRQLRAILYSSAFEILSYGSPSANTENRGKNLHEVALVIMYSRIDW